MNRPGGLRCDDAGAVDAGRAGDAAVRSGIVPGSGAAARSAALAEVIRSVAVAGRASTEQQSCTYGFGRCQRTDTRPYAVGGRWRCPDHTPAKLAGQPEPDSARYCLAVCYCGRCIHYRRMLTPITPNVIDLNAIKSGKRRSSPAAFREARDHTRGGAA